MADGRVVGVEADKFGEQLEFSAKGGVVLAAGGFEWNRALWDSLIGEPWDGPVSPPVNSGASITLAAAVGARLARLDAVWGVPARYLGECSDGERVMHFGYFGSAAGEILINRSGRRFVNEELNYHDIRRPMLELDVVTYERKNYPCFVIADSRRLSAVRAFEASHIDEVRGDAELAVVADTLRDLAAELGIDPNGLTEQITRWNEGVTLGYDGEFGRQTTAWGRYISQMEPKPLQPIDTPPFMGYRVRTGVFGTSGGAVIDENSQIVSMTGVPIPGLYGAGNATASIFATAYPGGGATLGPAVTMGFVAGREAARASSVQFAHTA